MKITHQGAPIVNPGVSYTRVYGDIIALEIDLASKYCQVVAHSVSKDHCPVIIIGAGEISSGLNEKVDRTVGTDVEFDGYTGWNIFLADIIRYTLRVCMVTL